MGTEADNPSRAVECHCACHPRPGNPQVHDAEPCSCQLTPEQRKANFDAFLASIRDAGERLDSGFTRERAGVAAEATRLGVTAEVTVLACPLVITGVVDNHFFFLRERWGMYKVVIAPDADPLKNVWTDRDDHEIEVSTGTDDDFLDSDGHYSAARALHVAVTAVRDHLRQRNCTHPDARAFCPDCGIRRSNAGN